LPLEPSVATGDWAFFDLVMTFSFLRQGFVRAPKRRMTPGLRRERGPQGQGKRSYFGNFFGGGPLGGTKTACGAALRARGAAPLRNPRGSASKCARGSKPDGRDACLIYWAARFMRAPVHRRRTRKSPMAFLKEILYRNIARSLAQTTRTSAVRVRRHDIERLLPFRLARIWDRRDLAHRVSLGFFRPGVALVVVS
jgi:hypothetical protein